MKKKKWLIPLIISIIIIIIIGIITFIVLKDKNKLTTEERKWIDDNINNVQNVYVVKDENIFSKDGVGVFHKFLSSFEEEYGLKINAVNLEEGISSGVIFNATNKKSDDIIYTDHYVLIGKSSPFINTISSIDNGKIGVLNTDLEYIKSYLKDYNINYVGYESIDEAFKGIDESVDYILIPRIKYIDKVLSEEAKIAYHFSDINYYYTLAIDESIFSNIVKKYYNKHKDELNDSIKEYEFELFKSSLSLKETDIDEILSVDYRYGLIDNSPYEVMMSGNFGGIIATYLHEFTSFSGVNFEITKYNSTDKLSNAIGSGKVDMYFDINPELSSGFKRLENGIATNLAVVVKNDSNKVFNSIYGLQNEEVYVLENSVIHNYLKTIDNIIINTYKDNNELFKLNNKDVIIVLDYYVFDYYKDSKLNNYVKRYEEIINDKYSFRIEGRFEKLSNLFEKYLNYLDNNVIINEGLISNKIAVSNGTLLNKIFKYIITLASILAIIWMIIYKKSKRIRIARRIKKDDKLKFIDSLTSLKNRAYLSDFMKNWNNNNIYPQTIIVVDLNNLKEINDHFGVEEGDKQIMAAANALIKTQLDNSDIMRSDGNEFVIYAVGYTNKQIANYIHKLNKELKKLPYDYGAEYGYSFIDNDLKTVEDALTEATIDMKSKKERK